jgi:fatty-acyl-CoA synthase
MIRRFDAIGVNLLQGWGMTETSPLATVSRLKPKLIDQPKDTQYAQLAKQGLTMPFVDIRLCNDEGHEMPWDGQQPGEIQVRGPWITASYYKLADSSDKFTPDGWLRTGDVGVIDTDGYLKLVDRTKDLIKSGGEWISSVDLENALMGHPAVAEATVIAIPHPKWDERPLAIIVKKSGSEVTAEELTAYLTTRFAKWMLPDDYRFVSEIAKTSTGKFNKKLLREQHINK